MPQDNSQTREGRRLSFFANPSPLVRKDHSPFKKSGLLHFKKKTQSADQDSNVISQKQETVSSKGSRISSNSSQTSLASRFSRKNRHSFLSIRRNKSEGYEANSPDVETFPVNVDIVVEDVEQRVSSVKQTSPGRPQFIVPVISRESTALRDKLTIRPAYHRSISFQSKNGNDDTLSPVSSGSSSSSAGEGLTSPIDNENGSHDNTPKKLRQRSRTLGDLDYNKDKLKKDVPIIEFTSSESKPLLVGFGNTQVSHSKSSSNMFSLFTNLVKSRRNSSIMVLDEVTGRNSETQLTPGSVNSDTKRDSGMFLSSTDHHSTPTTSSSTDYFSHRSGLSSSSIAGHRSHNSIGSVDRLSFLTPQEDETPASYVNKLISLYLIPDILPTISIKDTEFYNECLTYFLSFFLFHKEPIDISLRKFLAFNELPKEAQQIDRVLHAFSKEYCSQNTSTNFSVDVSFILAFSLLILHTDHFNPNNKRKMTKFQFVSVVKESLQNHLENAPDVEKDDVEFAVKNIVTKDILEYFYDNITFTAFKKLDECSKDQFLKVNGHRNVHLLDNESEKTIDDDPMVTKSFIKSNLSTTSLTPSGLNIRRRSSSFFTPASAGSDAIYDYLLGVRDLDELRLGYEFQLKNPFVNMEYDGNECDTTLNEDNILVDTEDRIDEIDERIFKDLMENMISSTPKILLKLATQRANVIKNDSRVEVFNGNEDTTTTYVTRVFKMGTVYRQEPKKLSSGTVWKPYFAVLTSIGLIFYHDANCLKPAAALEESSETVILEEQQSSGFFDSATDSGFIIYSHGLFASRLQPENGKKATSILYSQLDSLKFTIYGKSIRSTYSVKEKENLREWIFYINYLISLNDCFLNDEPQKIGIIEDDTMAEIRASASLTLLQKVNKSNKVLTSSLDLLKKLFGVCDSFHFLMPFHSKTRELATYSAKLLDTRISWCWFELNKNLIIVKVLLYAINTQEDQEDLTSIITRDNNNSTFDNKQNSLYREKTGASVLLVIDYSLENSLLNKSGDTLPLISSEDSDSDHESLQSLYYDCNEAN